MNNVVFQILLSLWDEPRGASAILRSIEELDPESGKPALASLYRALNKAVGAGWLEIVDVEPSQGRGRPGQQYRITPVGRNAVRGESQRLRRLLGAAQHLLSGSEAPG